MPHSYVFPTVNISMLRQRAHDSQGLARKPLYMCTLDSQGSHARVERVPTPTPPNRRNTYCPRPPIHQHAYVYIHDLAREALAAAAEVHKGGGNPREAGSALRRLRSWDFLQSLLVGKREMGFICRFAVVAFANGFPHVLSLGARPYHALAYNWTHFPLAPRGTPVLTPTLRLRCCCSCLRSSAWATETATATLLAVSSGPAWWRRTPQSLLSAP